MGALGRRVLDAARWLATEPPAVGRVSGEAVFLAAAVVVEWAAVAILAVSVPHNGWLFYQGGDQTFYYTIAWVVSHGHLPVPGIGYVWSLVEAPVAALAGPSFFVALPGIVLIQVVLLLPLGMVALYGTAKRLLGATVARAAVAVWVVAPFAVIPLFVGRYHVRWVDQTLPQLLGLSGMADFASMMILLCAAYLVFRHLDEGDWQSAALAGLVSGLAIGLKPSTALFVAGPAAGLALARRWRGGVAFGLALVPALVTLVVWKYRGLGLLPIFASTGDTRLASGEHLASVYVAAGTGVRRYVDLDWHHLGQNLDSIREYFWSNRLVEWIPVAGVLGALRVSRPKAAVLGVWLAAYVIFKGTSDVASVETASFWRLLSPAWPAYLLLGMSIVALVPGLGPRVRPAPGRAGAFRPATVGAVAAVCAALPLALVSALPLDHGYRAVSDDQLNLDIAVDPSFRVEAQATGPEVRLTWTGPGSGSVRTTYYVYRAEFQGRGITDGWYCDGAPVPRCELVSARLGYQTSPFVDRPGPGTWIYRVAQAATYTGNPGEGDPTLISQPVQVTVRAP